MKTFGLTEQKYYDAIADQLEAEKYRTFVALPFKHRYSYNPENVLEMLREVASRATKKRADKMEWPETLVAGSIDKLLEFAPPQSANELPKPAGDIVDAIYDAIIASHIFVADISFENPGVFFELGMAMASKPAEQIILIVDNDSKSGVHFDIAHFRIHSYRSGKEDIIKAFLHAACHFERVRLDYNTQLSERVSADAHVCVTAALNNGGKFHRGLVDFVDFRDRVDDPPLARDAKEIMHCVRFNTAVAELLRHKIIRNDYRTAVNETSDAYFYCLTRLGQGFAEAKWPHVNPPWRCRCNNTRHLNHEGHKCKEKPTENDGYCAVCHKLAADEWASTASPSPAIPESHRASSHYS